VSPEFAQNTPLSPKIRLEENIGPNGLEPSDQFLLVTATIGYPASCERQHFR
jgi:hypothetical protein